MKIWHGPMLFKAVVQETEEGRISRRH